ncbi:MAG: sigma-70 family RNA polymerase sigma factor [Vicinamibacteria bacterium]|nr:sigma-70 family RNA polymerase sigma factor [Vicinamibacteria bacterium]
MAARAEPASYADRADEWLVERCRESGDDAAFAELVRRYRGPVFRLAVSILGQEFAPEAEDVRGEAKFGSWIYRIAFNQALNVKARVRFRAPHVSDEALSTRASQDRGPDDRLQDQRRQRAVLACVGELPEVYQSALRLHYWLGASMSEIAVMLDAPENTVKSYLHRARRLLHARLTERGFDAR